MRLTRGPVRLVLVGLLTSGCLAPAPPATPAPSGSMPLPSTAAGGTVTPAPVGAAAIFGRVSPSVLFVGTPIGTGSGFVLDARHVVTNAHVVRPFAEARLVLADGTKVERAAVVGWDLFADLALLEVPDPIAAPPLASSGVLAQGIGDRVYLIGYPRADPATPKATITEGIVATAPVEWLDGLTFLETDATIDDGQSGGVIVDADGTFLGVTGGSRGNFGVALEATDALGRVARLARGEDADDLPDPLLPSAASGAPHDVTATVRNRADEHIWVLTGRQGDPDSTVSLTADAPVGLFALAAGGALGHGAGPPAKSQRLTVAFDPPGPYLIKVQSLGHAAVKARLHSTVGLTAVVEAEPGDPLQVDVPRNGLIEYGGDIDWFLVDLEKGQRVTVRVFGSGFDPSLFLDATGPTDETLATGHDAGGPLGTDDELSYTARATASYRIVVADGRFLGSGGYRVLVSRAS